MNKNKNKGYVYLLISEDQKSFKIGKANEVNTRLKQLNKFWEFNLNESLILEVDINNTINTEKLLHRFLKDFQLPQEEVNKKVGYTEFFDFKAFKYIKSHINSLKVLHKIKIFTFNEYHELSKQIKIKKEAVKQVKKIKQSQKSLRLSSKNKLHLDIELRTEVDKDTEIINDLNDLNHIRFIFKKIFLAD